MGRHSLKDEELDPKSITEEIIEAQRPSVEEDPFDESDVCPACDGEGCSECGFSGLVEPDQN